MVLLLQILLLVKQHFPLWPSLGSVFLGFFFVLWMMNAHSPCVISLFGSKDGEG